MCVYNVCNRLYKCCGALHLGVVLVCNRFYKCCGALHLGVVLVCNRLYKWFAVRCSAPVSISCIDVKVQSTKTLVEPVTLHPNVKVQRTEINFLCQITHVANKMPILNILEIRQFNNRAALQCRFVRQDTYARPVGRLPCIRERLAVFDQCADELVRQMRV
jgi:hypothetical protein